MNSLLIIISAVSFIFTGDFLINLIKKYQSDGNPVRVHMDSHIKKTHTPTMGGLIIGLYFFIFSTIFCEIKLISPFLFVFFSFLAVGFIDDCLKVAKKGGLSGKTRLILEIIASAIFLIMISESKNNGDFSLDSILFNLTENFNYLNLSSSLSITSSYFLLIPFAIFVLVGTANSVNLSDGLDGLAIVPIIFCLSFILILSFFFPEKLILSGFCIPEIQKMISIIIGLSLGFLWFNAKPAKVFLGDCGSLSLGGLIGSLFICFRSEAILAVVGFIFVLETMSVIIQVLYFKNFKTRIFLMAPIHHHYEKMNIPEEKIVVRFWIVSLISLFLGIYLYFN